MAEDDPIVEAQASPDPAREPEPVVEPSAHAPLSPPAAPLWHWWWQGLRSAFLLRPDWTGLNASPGVVVALLLAVTVVSVLTERFYIAGPASFYWQALLGGWFGTAVLAWICWWLPLPRNDGRSAPRSADLFSLLVAQSLPLLLAVSLLFVPAVRSGLYAQLGSWGSWIYSGIGIGWMIAAQWRLIWRSATGARRVGAGLLLATVLLLQAWGAPERHWYTDEPESTVAKPEPLRLTQPMMERQLGLLASQLQAVTQGQAGRVEMYSITFAPYAPEDVFMRESALVDRVMQQRFGAAGRSLQLVNNNAVVAELPWATPTNLQRAIQGMAARMDRDEDVLFLHLTSHGARNGKLAASLWPLAVEEVTPQQLKAWLDEAGIRYRVISVSACYAGSWIPLLADDHSLIMTAADADHTSYGCGRGSDLTYFGRAMYAEQLQQTLSFEAAHTEARRIIETREKEAGKTDGYSNPQIRMGGEVRQQLERLVRQFGAPR